MNLKEVQNKGTMKDWYYELEKQGVNSTILESEDKLKELEYLKQSGLPYQRFKIFSKGVTKKDVDNFVKKEGNLFWLSLVPKVRGRRFSKLSLSDYSEVKEFVNEMQVKPSDYHIILMQYPSKQFFSGTAIFNGLDGFMEFVAGKEHTFLARGRHTPDPAVIKKGVFEKYSSDINISNQREIAKMLTGKTGYFEFVRGVIKGEEKTLFFSAKYDDTHLNYFK